MRNRHERVIDSAKEWLNTVDREEFIAELLELQAESSGPTVDEFLSTFTLSTNSLFNLVQMGEDCHLVEQEKLRNIECLEVSKAIECEIIHSFGCDNPVNSKKYRNLYELKGIKVGRIPHKFRVDDDVHNFAKVA